MAEGWVSSSGTTLPSTCEVKTSKQSASTILFCKTGQTTIRQKETETVTEYRGLDETSAIAKIAASSDNTAQTGYYATFNGEDHSITVTTGTKTEVSARRVNDANGWTVTVREVTYSVEGLDTTVWKTSRTLTATSEIVVSVEKTTSYVFSMDGNVLMSKRTTTVKEKRHFSTKALAEAAYTASGHSYKEYKCGTNVVKKCTIPYGTERSVSVTFVSAEEGWTARATETVFDKAGSSAWTAV